MKPELSVSDQLALATFPVSLSLLHYISMNASGDVEGALAWLQLHTNTIYATLPLRSNWINLP